MRQSWEFQSFVGVGTASSQAAQPTELLTQENPRSKPRTIHYQGGSRVYFQSHRNLPLFTFSTIQAMLRDPQVRLCLAMRAAPIQSVEFAYQDGVGADGKPKWVPGVKAKDPLVAAWVLRQLQTIWNNYLPGILRSQTWGWAAGEVTFRLSESNLLEIDQLLHLHANDCRLLQLQNAGTPWGVRFSNIPNAGTIDLPFPHCYFVNFRPENGEKYSPPILLGAYSPWCDKWLNGGALDTRRLYMHKDAYGGMKVGYPEEQVYVDGNDNPIPARDIALQIVEQRQAGGTLTYPTSRDASGNPKWEIEEATVASNPQHILQYPKDLDTEIRQGMEIPDGAISNDGAGSWEGKSLPLAAFYSGLDSWVVQIICDIRQTLLPLAKWNFGENVEFEITHKPLAQTAMEQQGQKREGPDSSAVGFPGDPSGIMDDPSDANRPQRMGTVFDPVDAVGRGVLSATSIVEAARRALDGKTPLRLSAVVVDADDSDEGDEEADDRAQSIADILTHVFGDDAESHFDEMFGSQVQKMATWNAIDHPRGPNGRFIPKYSAEAVAAAKEKINEALNGPRSPSSLKTVTEHLSILTVKQLRDLQKEHGIRAGGAKPQLIAKIADRLHGKVGQTDSQASKFREDGTPKQISNRDIYTVPTSSLKVDAKRFQYKVKDIGEDGVTGELKGVSKWNPELAGSLLVWRDPSDGQDYVINGHHRHELASRLKADHVNARYIDAPNAKEARARGALANIAEGRGSAIDAAKYLRDSGQTLEHLRDAGISLSGRLAADAVTLVDLGEKSFQKVAEGRLEESTALAVAKHLKDPALQDLLFKKLAAREDDGKDWSTREIETAARKMANAGKVTQTGFDLFGAFEDEKSTFDQEVELESFANRMLQQEANDYRAVANKRRADRVSDAGNVLAIDENAKRAETAEQAVDDFNRKVHLRGPVNAVIQKHAAALLDAKSKKEKEAVKSAMLEELKSSLRSLGTSS